MQLSIHRWDELDLLEIAQLTHKIKEADKQASEDEAVKWIYSWLREQFSELPRFAILASSGKQLAGWVMLVVHDATRVEVNPWYLGGHPLVAPDQGYQQVGALLLQEAIKWARSEGFEVLELSIAWDLNADPQIYESFKGWYASHGFGVREESLGFFRRLSSYTPSALVTPEGIEVLQVIDVDQDELYRCYHDALMAGQSRLFFDQSEKERRAYFDTFGKTYALHEKTSLALIQDRQIVGFSYTIPFGDQYLHLDWFGIHPALRRRGLGHYLLQLIMVRAAGEGFQTIGLSCDAENSNAIALYHSLGWQQEDAELKFAAKL
jgi:ribosomal protein S18 acetylase RimI-like enzyme/predicted N-acetyltransferase YhbS